MSQALAVVSAGASIAGGIGERAALKTQARHLEFQAKAERLRGKQISAARREGLNETLAAIDSIRQSRGLDAEGLGSLAIRRKQRENSQANENAEVLSSNLREVDLRAEAAAKRRAAPFALLGGVASAAGTLLGKSG